MSVRHYQVILFVVISILINGCAWVKLTPGGEAVQLLTKDQVANCKIVGGTTVSVKDKIIGVKRKSEHVQGELISLARNSAARMDGDTIVKKSEVENGEQTFDVYLCK